MLEKPLMLDLHKSDGLARLGDVEDDYNLPYLGSPMWDRPFENLGRMTVQDWGHGAGALGNSGAWQYALIGTGAVLGSAALDRRVSRFVDRHAGSGAIDTADSVGKSLPLAAMFGAGLPGTSSRSSARMRPSPRPTRPSCGPPSRRSPASMTRPGCTDWRR